MIEIVTDPAISLAHQESLSQANAARTPDELMAAAEKFRRIINGLESYFIDGAESPRSAEASRLLHISRLSRDVGLTMMKAAVLNRYIDPNFTSTIKHLQLARDVADELLGLSDQRPHGSKTEITLSKESFDAVSNEQVANITALGRVDAFLAVRGNGRAKLLTSIGYFGEATDHIPKRHLNAWYAENAYLRAAMSMRLHSGLFEPDIQMRLAQARTVVENHKGSPDGKLARSMRRRVLPALATKTATKKLIKARP